MASLQVIHWGDNPEFEWDDGNLEEIHRHHVTWVEIEECFENPYWSAPHNKAKSDPDIYGDRYRIRGQTHGGRKLFIIIQHLYQNLVRVVTAFDC